ncbi:MAG: hypothetical protein QG646_3589 [Euryarchaeota archaeon]|nr:hypothetical protein [Euryarchaeota archaeon]
MLLCECGELVSEDIFKDYIKTTANPSTRTIGHKSCGFIFNFIDEMNSKKYSSRKELKILAGKFAGKNLSPEYAPQFMLAVDRLKSKGRLQDYDILIRAYREVLGQNSENPVRKKA